MCLGILDIKESCNSKYYKKLMKEFNLKDCDITSISSYSITYEKLSPPPTTYIKYRLKNNKQIK